MVFRRPCDAVELGSSRSSRPAPSLRSRPCSALDGGAHELACAAVSSRRSSASCSASSAEAARRWASAAPTPELLPAAPAAGLEEEEGEEELAFADAAEGSTLRKRGAHGRRRAGWRAGRGGGGLGAEGWTRGGLGGRGGAGRRPRARARRVRGGSRGGKREVASAPIRHVCLFARLLSGGRRGAVSRSAGAHARARRDWVRRVQRAAAAARNVPGDEATACAGRAQGRQAGAALAQRAATVPRAAYLLSGAGGSTGSRPTARLLRVRALRAVGRIAVREPAGPGACHEEVWRQRMQPRRPPPRALPGLRSGAVRRVRATRGVVGGGVRPARGGSGPLGGASAPRQDVWRVSSSRLHASPGGATRGQARQGYEQSACQHAARRCAMTGRAARWGGGGGRGAGGRLWTEFLGANLEKEWLLPPPDLMSEPRRRRLAVVDCLFGKF